MRRLFVCFFTLTLASGCSETATNRIPDEQQQQPMPAGPEAEAPTAEPGSGEPSAALPPTTPADTPFPWEITEGTAPATETTPAPPPADPLSPPPVGVEDLAQLPEAQHPARRASLNLTQEGRLALNNRDFLAARQKLQSALQIWGNNGWAKYYLGLVLFYEGQYAQSATFAKAAVRQVRQYPFWGARAQFLLGEALERMGQGEQSVRAKNQAYAQDPRVELK